MANPNISNYVRQEIQKGISREKIQKELIEAGWSVQDVSDAIAPYPDQNFSASSETTAVSDMDTGPVFSSSPGNAAYIPEKNPAITTFNIENISDTKESRINRTEKQGSPKRDREAGFRMANIGAFFLVFVIGGSIFFVIRQISGALNTGVDTQLTTPTSGETAVQKIRNQNQDLAGQTGTGSSTPILYPSGNSPENIPQNPGQVPIGNPISSNPQPTSTPSTAVGTPIVGVPSPAGQITPPIGTPLGSQNTPPGQIGGQTPGTPFTPPSPIAPPIPPSAPIGTPFIPPPAAVSQNSTSSASQTPGSPSPTIPFSPPSKTTTPTSSHTTPVPLPTPIFPPTLSAPADSLRIISMKVSNITSGSADIEWTSNHLVFFRFEYGMSTSYGSSYPVNSIPITLATFRILNLAPITAYHYRLKLADGSGSSVSSPDAVFTTNDIPTSIIPISSVPGNSSNTQSIGDQLNAIKARLLFLLESLKI